MTGIPLILRWTRPTVPIPTNMQITATSTAEGE
jgi:hypothetical protein